MMRTKGKIKRKALHSADDLNLARTKNPIGCAIDRVFGWPHYLDFLVGLGGGLEFPPVGLLFGVLVGLASPGGVPLVLVGAGAVGADPLGD